MIPIDSVLRFTLSISLVIAVHGQAFAAKGEEADGDAQPVTNRTASQLLCTYRPTYFAIGHPTTRFQFSLRYALWVSGDESGSCRRTSRQRDIELGYTQMSTWRLFEMSSPFEETNYNPEIFYRENLRLGFLRALQLGVEHQSNGLAGERSRSWDRVYLHASLGNVSDEERWGIRMYPKVWWVLPPTLEDPNNAFAENIGFGQLTVAVTTPRTAVGDGEFDLQYRPGDITDVTRGSLLIGTSWNVWSGKRVPRAFGFTPDLYAQYFVGYAETLARADDFRSAFRVGLRLRK